MKLSTGADIEQVSRFDALLEKERFCRRVFTPGEREHIAASGHPAQTAAGIFCAKEAMAKALGRGLYGLLPQELEVVWDANGAPRAALSGSAAAQYGEIQLSLSISHTKDTALAVCTALEL